MQTVGMTSYDYVIIQTTTDTAAIADELAAGAVELHLAACVQISQVNSYYRWEDGVQNDQEYLLSFKTSATAVQGLKEYLAAHHPYDEPEIIVLPIIDGSRGYLQWLTNSIS